MKTRKLKILLLWGYQRKSWVEPFEKLRKDFEFCFLYYQKKEFEKQVFTTIDKYYYNQFNSVQQLFKEVKPDKLVFMSIDSPITVLLNLEAQKRNIETIILQHGVFHSMKTYRELELKQQVQQREVSVTKTSFDSRLALEFLLRSTRLYNLKVWKYLFLKRRYERNSTIIESQQKLRLKMRFPQRFLVYSKEVSKIFTERDGINESYLEEIGFIEFDDFFISFNKADKVEEEPYALLIDFPLSPIAEFNTNGYGFSHEDVLTYHHKLAEYAKSQGFGLKVKLHPYQYPVEQFITNDKITYIREGNTSNLINGAKMIYGFSSTLMLLAIYTKPVGIFTFLQHSDFISGLVSKKLVKPIPFPAFSNSDLQLLEEDENQLAKKRTQLLTYFKFVDGKSLDRLKTALNK